MLIQKIHNHFHANFFSRSKQDVLDEIQIELSMYLDTNYDVSHFADLYDLGYLPIEIKALDEGTLVPMKIPVFTVRNTMPLSGAAMFWITNYLETFMSCEGWLTPTAATIALRYKRIVKNWCKQTNPEAIEFTDWQCHDFSMRGMGSIDASINSGIGHASVFLGSDTLPVIHAARKYYNAEGFVIGSVNATEHSVMCAGSKDDEIGTFRTLMEKFPKRVLSVVSDTWDLWRVLTEYLPELKEEDMGELKPIFHNGEFVNTVSFDEIRAKIDAYDIL